MFFFRADGSVSRFAQPLYASLARGEVAMPEFASKCLRVADWYVLYDADTAISIDNETYLVLWFDAAGHARPYSDMSCAPRSGSPWTPTPDERQRLSSIIFGRRDPTPH